MSAVYPYDAARRNGHLIERASLALEVILQEMRPGVAAIFSAFPSLLRNPSWLPGMRLKTFSLLAKQDSICAYGACLSLFQAAGTVSSSMVADHLLKLDESDGDSTWQQRVVKDSAATATADSGCNDELHPCDDSPSRIPDLQEKAHKLIENVVSTKGLLTFQDRPSLTPFYASVPSRCYDHPECLVRTIVILGIPAGLIPNLPLHRAMCHNESKYPNASEFNPDRFLNAVL
ncbi:hypothetical protein EDB19DRAFT_1825215 [Suillus lakei]|nr:hypothetical protein EDB19DRAFT_1825215 [Suillus lakei]